MKFILDNCLSKALARALNILDLENEIVHLKDEFPEITPDAIWLQNIGQRNIFLITRDRHILRRAAEIHAVRKFCVGAFFIIGKHLDRWQIIRFVIDNWQKILTAATEIRRPFAYRIKRNKIEQLPL